MRPDGKIAMVGGAGQSPGETIGNGRATVLLFARDGAKVVAVNRDLASAGETAEMITDQGGACLAVEADVTQEHTLVAAIAAAHDR